MNYCRRCHPVKVPSRHFLSLKTDRTINIKINTPRYPRFFCPSSPFPFNIPFHIISSQIFCPTNYPPFLSSCSPPICRFSLLYHFLPAISFSLLTSYQPFLSPCSLFTCHFSLAAYFLPAICLSFLTSTSCCPSTQQSNTYFIAPLYVRLCY